MGVTRPQSAGPARARNGGSNPDTPRRPMSARLSTPNYSKDFVQGVMIFGDEPKLQRKDAVDVFTMMKRKVERSVSGAGVAARYTYLKSRFQDATSGQRYIKPYQLRTLAFGMGFEITERQARRIWNNCDRRNVGYVSFYDFATTMNFKDGKQWLADEERRDRVTGRPQTAGHQRTRDKKMSANDLLHLINEKVHNQRCTPMNAISRSFQLASGTSRYQNNKKYRRLSRVGFHKFCQIVMPALKIPQTLSDKLFRRAPNARQNSSISAHDFLQLIQGTQGTSLALKRKDTTSKKERRRKARRNRRNLTLRPSPKSPADQATGWLLNSAHNANRSNQRGSPARLVRRKDLVYGFRSPQAPIRGRAFPRSKSLPRSHSVGARDFKRWRSKLERFMRNAHPTYSEDALPSSSVSQRPTRPHSALRLHREPVLSQVGYLDGENCLSKPILKRPQRPQSARYARPRRSIPKFGKRGNSSHKHRLRREANIEAFHRLKYPIATPRTVSHNPRKDADEQLMVRVDEMTMKEHTMMPMGGFMGTASYPMLLHPRGGQATKSDIMNARI